VTVTPRGHTDAGDLAAAIAAEATRLGLGLPADAADRLAAYAASLWAWNERLNLTRHADVERFVARDLGDAAAIADHLAHGERVLDVGTGGGVPGVILAILRPDLRVELCDSVAKKARAVGEIVREAGLTIPVHATAAQELVARRPTGGDRFDTLVVRAVAPLAKLLGWFEPLATSYGRLLVIKGPRWQEELAEARDKRLGKKVVIRRIAAWPLRGSDNESVLLEIRAAG
jgi:16S rRNA (guanine527-N7)-methyltransferase